MVFPLCAVVPFVVKKSDFSPSLSRNKEQVSLSKDTCPLPCVLAGWTLYIMIINVLF